MTLVWFVLGLVAAYPLVKFADRLKHTTAIKLLGRSLIIAALIYIGFAVMWGDHDWLAIEALGVVAYGLFYVIAIKQNSLLWIGLGWGLHPIWDMALHLLGPGHHVVPEWYAIACMSFDFYVAGYAFIRHRRVTNLKAA